MNTACTFILVPSDLLFFLPINISPLFSVVNFHSFLQTQVKGYFFPIKLTPIPKSLHPLLSFPLKLYLAFYSPSRCYVVITCFQVCLIRESELADTAVPSVWGPWENPGIEQML